MEKARFFEHYDRIDDIFDLMALCIRYIRMTTKENVSIDIKHPKYKGIDDIFQSYINDKEVLYDDLSLFRNCELPLS